jgi:hypothetical protein
MGTDEAEALALLCWQGLGLGLGLGPNAGGTDGDWLGLRPCADDADGATAQPHQSRGCCHCGGLSDACMPPQPCHAGGRVGMLLPS